MRVRNRVERRGDGEGDMKKQKQRLLPCPFCGSDNVSECADYPPSRMECNVCGAVGPGDTDFEDDAAEQWNKRTP